RPRDGQLLLGLVLVSVLDEVVAGRFANSHADYVLAVFLELHHQRGKIQIPGQQDECPDLGSREDELQRVDREADVGGVFLIGPVRRCEDEIDGRFGEGNEDRKSTRLNSSHQIISYAVFCLKKKTKKMKHNKYIQ